MGSNKIIKAVIFFVFIINIFIPTIVLAIEEIEGRLKNEIKLEESLEEKEKIDLNVDEGDTKQEDEYSNEELKIETEHENNKNNNEIVDLENIEEKERIKNKGNGQIEKEEEKKNSISVENISKIKYSSHIQDYGWEDEFSRVDGETSGKEGKNKRIEAIKITLGDSEEILESSSIKYKVHVQDYGWLNWKQDGQIAGTIGKGKRIEAIRIKIENLEGYSVVYRTYVENIGWTDWVNNGEVSGTEGKGLKIEAIKIKIVEIPKINVNYSYNEEKNIVTTTVVSNKEIKNVVDDNNWIISDDKLSCSKEIDINDTYTVKIKDIDNIEKKIDFEINQIKEPICKIKYYSFINESGWEKKYSKIDGDISGTQEHKGRIEAVKIELGNSKEIPKNAIVKYQVHIQDKGWTGWKENGEVAGTIDENKRIEAININIDGVSGYSVEYRTYVQNIGWQKWVNNGQMSGTTGEEKAIEAIQVRIVRDENIIISPTIKYQAHVQNIGWQNEVYENKVAGTIGYSNGIEALKIKLQGVSEEAKVKYQAHVSNYGWQNWVCDGEEAGTTRQYKSIEAIKIKMENLEGYSIEYRVYVLGRGWQKWKKNGEEAGTTGLSRKIEAIQIRIVYKDSETLEPELSYQAHIQNIGWQNTVSEGFVAGTEGKFLRVEALRIFLADVNSNAKILYRTHIQDIGWQGWKANGNISGTEGQAKRIETLEIKLEGLENYTVEYKVHIQDYGWSDWRIDGETAGTTGKAKRIEAIQIRLVPKYYRNYKGIDVSEHNGNINWNAVKNSGVQFAMIRCAYRGYRTGRIVEDSQFRNNMNGASKNGIKVGLYFFSQATSIAEAIEEANYTINLARQYKNIAYPIAIDTEMSGADYNDGRADGLNTALRTNIVVSYCNQVKNNNYIPIVYASRDWFYNNLEISRLSNYEIWLAHYTGSLEKRSNYKYGYSMWQYTSSGSVPGISGNVDLNIGYKKY